MLLRHPEVASRPCDVCKLYRWNPDGTIEHFRPGVPTPNPTGYTPCSTCPKKSPDKAHKYELSNKNRQTLALYYRTRAMSGVNLSDAARSDPIVQKNLAIIDRIVRAFEAEQAALAGATRAITLSAGGSAR